MLYDSSSKTKIIQPFFIKSNPTDTRIAFQSTTAGGAPLNLQYDGKTLRQVYYFSRTDTFTPTSSNTASDNYAKVSYTSYNGTAEYPLALQSYRPLIYKSNFTKLSYNGGLSTVYSENYTLTGNGLWVKPARITASTSTTVYIVAVMTASILSNYNRPYLCYYTFTDDNKSGGVAAVRQLERVSIYSTTECIATTYITTCNLSSGIYLSVCAAQKDSSWNSNSNCIIRDIMIGIST